MNKIIEKLKIPGYETKLVIKPTSINNKNQEGNIQLSLDMVSKGL
ncbi:hypothetical protein GCM10011409_44290 [Lentibacillus populi]|uniref:Uncharacterized protein n=1 Tax=Lentibacillus populi TaxID=1827502 RepID=A0A9W5U1V2_9BACI|nr:hypothetical protein [Lentibacillus populi]GGB62251.1 hypothetical protein GCM10011409_44290 [Lentibacillus populi]